MALLSIFLTSEGDLDPAYNVVTDGGNVLASMDVILLPATFLQLSMTALDVVQ
jgi:hypothetical protein